MLRPLTRRGLRIATAVIGMSLTLLMIFIAGRDITIFSDARDAVHDAFMRVDPRPFDPTAPVHIIDIDEASLGVYGQWPWPRTYLAVLTEKLYQHGAVAVGYDVLFAEPDRTASPAGSMVPPDSAYQALPPPFSPPDDHDQQFAAALGLGPSVLGIAGAPQGVVPQPIAGISFTGSQPQTALTSYPAALVNREVLTDAAQGVGMISLGARGDGTVRAVPLISDVGGTLMPAFSMELLRVAQGAQGYILRTTEASGERSGGQVQAVGLRVGGVDLPLDGDGQFRVYYAGVQPMRQTSAAQVLGSEGIDPELADRVAGRIVLIGSSAQGLFDIRATPLQPNVPGVVIHAEIIEQVAAGQFLTRPDWARGLEVLTIALTGLILSLALAAERPVLGVGATIGAISIALAGSNVAFRQYGLLLDPVFPVLTALVVFLPGVSFGFFAKERARAAVRARFSYFLPPDLVDEIADDPQARLTPEGADRELTVLFADIRGFTGLTENMAPADTVRFVNRFLATISDALLASGATIDKFMGDAVMAFWNAPLENPNHRIDALRSIPLIEAAMEEANAALADDGLPQIDVAIGINTGPASVGLMGSSDRLSYTCIGDSVTLAARLEGLTRRYDVANCVAPDTVVDLPDGLRAIELDVIAVKGRQAAQPVFTVVVDTPEAQVVAKTLSDARAAYLAQEWDRSAAAFAALSDQNLAGRSVATLCAEYTSRIEAFRAAPPPAGWDGSARATEKR